MGETTHSKNKLVGLTMMFVMWGLLYQGLAFIAPFELSKLHSENIRETSTYASGCQHTVNDPATRMLSIVVYRV